MTPLSGYAASPQGDGSLGAGRPFLAAPLSGHAGFMGSGFGEHLE